MRSTTETVEGNQVRLSVEIDEEEVERILEDSYRNLSRSARVPGFRPGKVPRKVLEARLGGPQAIRAEALREALPDLYVKAVTEAELDPITAPELDITAGAEEGPVTFDAVVQVRPIVGIPGYAGLRVEVPALAATDEEIDGQVDRMRETEAELVEVSRPAVAGDHVTIDVQGTGSDGQEVVTADDYLYEVGSGGMGPEADAALLGSSPGDVLSIDTQADLTPVTLRVLVKEVKEKRLPEVTDEWVSQSSEFDTVDELRADLRARLGRVKLMQAQLALRENTMAALAGLVEDDEVPSVLVDAEVEQRLHNLEHRLSDQGLNLDVFMASTGRSAEDLVTELRSSALQDVKGDLALYALAEAEDVTVTDEEIDAEIEAMAERVNMDAKRLRSRLEHEDRIAAVRSERRKLKALQWLLDNVELVDTDGNPVSREELRADREAPGDGEEPDGTTAGRSELVEATIDDGGSGASEPMSRDMTPDAEEVAQ